MQEPTVNPETQTTPPPDAATGADAGAETQAMDTEAFIAEMLKARGPAPGVGAEGITDIERQILEQQYRQDTRFMISDIQEAIREISPNVERRDLQQYALAAVQNDSVGMWKIAQEALRKETEREQNDTKLQDLRVEGANSGTRGTEAASINSTDDAFTSILNKIRAA